MDGSEMLVLLVSVLVAGIGWTRLFIDTYTVSTQLSPRALRPWLWLAPALGTSVVYAALRTLASYDVRNAPLYVFFYSTLGLAWMRIGSWHGLGVSVRDDVLERGNGAALVTWSGAIVGCAVCYAGANIGDGPGWWCVLWAGSLGTLGWIATWALLHALTRIADHVTIDRDLASGTRAAGFLVASAVLWARGAAGDWTSAAATVVELSAAWPVAILLVKAAATERWMRPRPEMPNGPLMRAGILPVLLDVPLVALGLVLAGPIPDGYPTPGAF